jgi:hypothetical protein
VLLTATLLAGAACRGAFDATNPDAVTGTQVTNNGAAIVPAMITGVAANFATAQNQLVTGTGIYSDELVSTGIWGGYRRADSTGLQDITSTDANGGNITEPVWNYFQATRVLAERAYAAVAGSGPVAADKYAAQARVYSGMSYLALGEYFCDVAFDAGPSMQPIEAIKKADAQLTEAIAIGTAAGLTSGVNDFVSLAKLMRARAKFDQGLYAAAEADAAAVPNSFSWLTRSVVAGGSSWLWGHTIGTIISATVGPAFANTGDPRVPVKPGVYASALIPLVVPQKYPNGDTPDILTNWQEARLIQAEVRLKAGDVATAIGLLNQVRTAAALTAYNPASTPAQAQAALLTETGNQLFLQGRRLLIMERNGIKPPEYTATAPFANVCIPVPQSERDNNHLLGTLHSTRSVTTFTAP